MSRVRAGRALTFADLFARNRSDVRNIPAHAGECFHRGDDPENDKTDVNDRCDNGPEENEDAADSWNRAKDRVHDCRNDVEQEPGQTEDDRLHRIEAHEWVVFFQNEKHDTANERNTGQRCRDV